MISKYHFQDDFDSVERRENHPAPDSVAVRSHQLSVIDAFLSAGFQVAYVTGIDP